MSDWVPEIIDGVNDDKINYKLLISHKRVGAVAMSDEDHLRRKLRLKFWKEVIGFQGGENGAYPIVDGAFTFLDSVYESNVSGNSVDLDLRYRDMAPDIRDQFPTFYEPIFRFKPFLGYRYHLLRSFFPVAQDLIEEYRAIPRLTLIHKEF